MNYDSSKTTEIKELVELTAFFLTSEIASHILMQKLEFMSQTDLLTCVMNRNAMNQRVDLFVRGEKQIEAPFGVIFADVNGLKHMNDENGHESGDELLKQAAGLLKEIFSDYEIYRSGGDEFVVILPACNEEQFSEKLKELKSRSGGENGVSLAVGSHWNEEGKNLRLSMHIADEEMYKDKEKFYETHKEFQKR